MKGAENVVADALSRGPVAPTLAECSIDLRELAALQCHDKVNTECANSSLKIKAIHLQGVKLLCDVSLGHPRPYVPEELRYSVFTTFHTASHPGPRITTSNIGRAYIWRSYKRDIIRWCRECQAC